MIGLKIFFITLFLAMFIFFIKFSYYLSFVLDGILVGGLAGYGSYLYIVPAISSGEAKWFWIILFGILAIIIYFVIYTLVVNLCGVVGVIFNFIVSVICSAAFCAFMKSFFDSLYRSFVLKTKDSSIQFTLFKNPSYDYIIYAIVILLFGWFIHNTRMRFINNDLT